MNSRHIGYLIKSINDKMKIKADADLRSHNMTLSQSRVVAFLSEKGGAATQKELEDDLGVSHPTVVGLVSRMEQNGVVRSYFAPNSRSKTVELTAEARDVAESMHETISKDEARMLDGLTEPEIETMIKALNTVLNNIDKQS